MSSALFLLNAIAIAILMAFHFQPADNAELTGSATARHPQSQAPQLAVMNTQIQPGVATRVTEGQNPQRSANTQAENWVF
ncbi:hypothetical protein GV819_10480 [Pseudomonas sp. Fl5BN2]|uniref:hypothetical protein n=1 Tax=unclassified Pseudomonas TaxID=196821 RepID=UPI0013768B41|nr:MULTISPECIES: hypothetical protein [unclassified Pseudomonas]NBF02713.1 hypothetical protein [Pseudomonas sp. Fl5BN2]NBF08599.1 hypothetical protein [Pseudomonas sp. Fl4BN1]